jgi:S-adenosylmethionine decarboxylase
VLSAALFPLSDRRNLTVPNYEGTEMCSYAIDAWLENTSLLTDQAALLALLRETAAVGHAVVLGEACHQFPNGAVTATLVLSQSHLSVHTWPEYGSVNVDLLTCGRLSGESMLHHLSEALRPLSWHVSRVIRVVRDPVAGPAPPGRPLPDPQPSRGT